MMATEQNAHASSKGCPVHHDHRSTANGSAEEPATCPAHAQADAAAAAAPAGCPAHRAPAGGDAAADSSAPGPGRPEQEEAQEPQPQESQPQKPQPDAEAKPMKCPLGFGSDNTAKLDPLNCVLCRSLYHEVHTLLEARALHMWDLSSRHVEGPSSRLELHAAHRRCSRCAGTASAASASPPSATARCAAPTASRCPTTRRCKVTLYDTVLASCWYD